MAQILRLNERILRSLLTPTNQSPESPHALSMHFHPTSSSLVSGALKGLRKLVGKEVHYFTLI